MFLHIFPRSIAYLPLQKIRSSCCFFLSYHQNFPYGKQVLNNFIMMKSIRWLYTSVKIINFDGVNFISHFKMSHQTRKEHHLLFKGEFNVFSLHMAKKKNQIISSKADRL